MEIKLKGGVSPSGAFEGIGSTSALDRDGEIIRGEAYRASIGKRVPLLSGHREPCGSVVPERISDQGLHVRGRINLGCEAGRGAYALVSAGDITGLSVGARIKKHSFQGGTRVIEDLELLEVSIVPVPSNPEARITAVKGFGEMALSAARAAADEMALVECSILKAAGDPILTDSTYPAQSQRVDPQFVANPGTWLTRLMPVPVSVGAVAAPRLTGFEGDAAEQAGEGAAIAAVHPSFDLADLVLPTWSAHVPCSKQVLDDSPSLAVLVFEFLRSLIVRKIEARAASDLVALAGAADANAFVACGELEDLGLKPSFVLMSPKKVWALAQSQTNQDAPPRVGGLPVLPSAGLTAAQGLAICAPALRFVEREQVTIDLGYINAQFTSNMRTVRANARATTTISDLRAVRHFTVA